MAQNRKTRPEGPAEKELGALIEAADHYAFEAYSKNTQRSYDSDWRHYLGWCVSQNLAPTPPDTSTMSLYITACASPRDSGIGFGLNPSSINRRLAALAHHFHKCGFEFSRSQPALAKLITGIGNRHSRPVSEKHPLSGREVIELSFCLAYNLCGVRNRALLLVCFAGGLKPGQLIGLDCGPDQSHDGTGWVEIGKSQLVVHLKMRRNQWRSIVIGSGADERTCPVVALKKWIWFGRVKAGPLFRPLAHGGKRTLPKRLEYVTFNRMIKKVARRAPVGRGLNVREREMAFSAGSLRAGFAANINVDEHLIQEQLGHSSPDMIRVYRERKNRFQVNLLKSSGL